MTLPDTATTDRPFSEVDVSSPQFWAQQFEERDASFAALRRTGGLTWHEPLQVHYGIPEAGFWAATRAEDIAAISDNRESFTSTQGVGLAPMPKEAQQPTAFFLMMDPPEHTFFRRLVTSAFTPKAVARMRGVIDANATEIVDGLIDQGEFDFVDACSSLLPMRTVSDMIGIAHSDRETIRAAAHAMFAGLSPEQIAAGEDPAAYFFSNLTTITTAAAELARDRRANPKDDLMSNIVQAEVDGQRLTDEQIGAFMVLLSTAGNDTTKQTTSISAWALAQRPDQQRWLMEDFDGRINTAIEEFVRFSSPVIAFARFAKEDVQVGDVTVRAGEKVGLFYCSVNRDETLFERPGELILDRFPNPHMAFGGGGAHYCLGNQVAKQQLRSIFSEMLTRIPTIEFGEPEWIRHNSFVNGIERMPARIR
ncbi:cytochrome P450 [Microbacterium rhizomatis]|uniref:Cytochrome P450 n=1 Tax=Microbacterium rhizomatis TaxID=1631477 RepID=A0A5J5J079_9MICO|nr:cytochrome P450 [Microbacterium rhizomatis]